MYTRCFVILALATYASASTSACSDDDDADSRRQEQGYDGPLTFAPTPACPAPNTPQAVHYQESGGAENALLWYMTMHALSGPSYEVHHHHHGYAAPTRFVTRPVQKAYYPRLKTTRTVPPIPIARPASTPSKAPILKPSPGGRAPAWTAKPSKSFGYKPPPSKPASTSFRPSSAPSPRSTTSFRSSTRR